MARLAIFIGFLSLHSGALATLLGSTKCSWGPSYWCKNIQQSKECAATRHCIQRFWTDMTLPEDNDDVCTICKNMVQQARDTLRSNETIYELKEVFETSCGYIPVKVISDECKVLSDQFVAELVETLSSEMDPQLVCATAGLCNSERVDKILAKYYESNPKTECDVCKSESNKLVYEISRIPGKKIENKLLELCGYMSSYSDACRATVTENFDLIHSMLKSIGDGELCKLVGICTETNQNYLAKYTNPNNPKDVQCEFCEKVIQHWVDTWTANTTEAEFKQVLEALCHRMSKPERVSRCLHIVDDYYLPWFNFLLHEVDPHTLCSLVGLCGSGSFMQLDDEASVTLLLNTEAGHDDISEMKVLQPAIRMPGQEQALPEIDVSQGLIGGYFVPQTVAVAEKPGCTICEFAVKELDNFIGNDKTEGKIERAVSKLCHKLPDAVKNQCDNLVSTYGPALVQLLLHEIDSSEICSRLNLCEADILLQQVSHPLPLQVLKRSQDSCALCEFAMTEVFSILNDTSDRQMVINVLDSICYKMPSSIRNECQKLVATYMPVVADLIVNSVTPDQICEEIKMCKATKEIEPVVAKVNDEKCVLCEYVITTLDKMISDKHNEDEVRKALDNLCNHMPSSINKKCVKFVDTYSELVIDYLSQDLSPEEVCQQLRLCQESLEEHFHSVRENRPYCTLCEYAIGEVDKLIADKKNEEEIKKALDRICYELSSPIMKECVNMVNQYTDKIIDLFVAEYTPQQICQEIGLCKPSKPRQLTNEIISNDISKKSQVTKSQPFCVVCQFAMSVLEDKILNNRTLDIVERAVQMVCSYLPESAAEQCEEFVDEYGDKIIKIIFDNELAPKEVCDALTLCDKTETKPAAQDKLLGQHRCIWGPAFWCKSLFHAKSCGTIKHCRKYVWGKKQY